VLECDVGEAVATGVLQGGYELGSKTLEISLKTTVSSHAATNCYNLLQD